MSETITTFDGVVHDKEEIIEKMYDDDFYYGYLGKQALSSSSLKKLLSSPNEYLRSLEEEDATESQPLRDGKLFHWNVLEPEKFEELRVIDVASKNTKAYKTAKAEFGEVYCRNEIEKAESLASVLKNNKPAMAFLENADFEVPQIDVIDGIPFRGKADIVQGTKIIDLKTTADLEGFNLPHIGSDMTCKRICIYNYSLKPKSSFSLSLIRKRRILGFLTVPKNS